MDEKDLSRLLGAETDIEKARLEAEMKLEIARLDLERERADREEARFAAERRNWYATPFFIGISAALLSVAGTLTTSLYQGSLQRELEQQRASNQLLVSVLSAEEGQQVENLRFLIAAGLIEDDAGTIIAAAEEFQPRVIGAAPSTTAPQAVTARRIVPPIVRDAILDSVSDGDTVVLRSPDLIAELQESGGVRPSHGGQTLRFSLKGVDAHSRTSFGCFSLANSVFPFKAFGVAAHDALVAYFPGFDEERDSAFPDVGPRREDASGYPVRVMVVGVDPFGRAVGYISRRGRTAETPETFFPDSVNAHLVATGAAVPVMESTMTQALRNQIRAVAEEARAAARGVHADMVDSFDPGSDRSPLLHPWLQRRFCSSRQDDRDFEREIGLTLAALPMIDQASGTLLSYDTMFTENADGTLSLRVDMLDVISASRLGD